MNKLFREMYYFFSKFILKLKNNHLSIKYGGKVSLKSKFEGYNKISRNAYFSGELGYASYIGENSIVIGKVGRFCSIAGNVVCLNKTHPVHGFVSTSPCFYSTKKQSGFTFVDEQKFDETPKIPGSEEQIIIGNDVYIGYGATIIAPVVIGDGAVIAANSTVTKNVEPYTIVGGTPAKVIGKRFTEEETNYLMRLKWWEKDIRWIKENAKYFESVSDLMKREWF